MARNLLNGSQVAVVCACNDACLSCVLRDVADLLTIYLNALQGHMRLFVSCFPLHPITAAVLLDYHHPRMQELGRCISSDGIRSGALECQDPHRINIRAMFELLTLL
jgi:hypothetical protein